MNETVEPLCMNCEYFDALGSVLEARSGNIIVHGDCVNIFVPSVEITSADSCGHFVPDSYTWPSDNDTWV